MSLLIDRLEVAAGMTGGPTNVGFGGVGGDGGGVTSGASEVIAQGAYTVTVGTAQNAQSQFIGNPSGNARAGGAIGAPDGGNGITGVANDITGASLTYGSSGGGGGTGDPSVGGLAGTGAGNGGGNNGVTGPQNGDNAATFGSGGGGGAENAPASGQFAPGVVYIAYRGIVARATGGTITGITRSGAAWMLHTFTASGTFTVLPNQSQFFQVF